MKQHQHFGTLGALTDVLKDRRKEKEEKNTKDEVVLKKKKTAKQAMEELNKREESMKEADASEDTVKNIINKVKQKGGTITYGELAAELRRC